MTIMSFQFQRHKITYSVRTCTYLSRTFTETVGESLDRTLAEEEPRPVNRFKRLDEDVMNVRDLPAGGGGVGAQLRQGGERRLHRSRLLAAELQCVVLHTSQLEKDAIEEHDEVAALLSVLSHRAAGRQLARGGRAGRGGGHVLQSCTWPQQHRSAIKTMKTIT